MSIFNIYVESLKTQHIFTFFSVLLGKGNNYALNSFKKLLP